MPLYDMKCKKCGKVAEYLIRNKEDLPVECECGHDEFDIVYDGNVPTVVYNYADCTIKQPKFGE